MKLGPGSSLVGNIGSVMFRRTIVGGLVGSGGVRPQSLVLSRYRAGLYGALPPEHTLRVARASRLLQAFQPLDERRVLGRRAQVVDGSHETVTVIVKIARALLHLKHSKPLTSPVL